MIENIVVTSPFVDENSQLFYQATYNTKNQKLSLKIFNHKGVLKNKRVISLNQPIADLFTTEEYLIGLNHNHHQIYIFDVRKHLKTMTTGQLNSKSGMIEKMRNKNEKFTLFFFNRQQPLIYGVFDHKHIFYFRLNNFSSADQSSLTNSRNTKESLSELNYGCEIGIVYTLSQPISKLEVQYKKRLIQFPQSNKKISIVLELSEDDKQQRLECLRKQQNIQKQIREQTVTYIYLLVEHKRQKRTLQVIWHNDHTQVNQSIQDGIHDFCYRNGWDLILKSNEKDDNRSMKRNDTQKVELLIKTKGSYQGSLELSGNHKIFCSEQNIFIVDPNEQKISGIYNRQFISIEQCQTLPHSISHQKTLLMLERPDYKHLKFIFYVFNLDLSQFTAFPSIVSIYNFQNLADPQMYLSKNIEKIFTPNGLIHPHFQQKVSAYLKMNSNLSQFDSGQSENFCQEQEKEMMMRREDEESNPNVHEEQNPLIQSKQFLAKFVLRDTNLLYRVVYELCNYGAEIMFGGKVFADSSVLKDKNHQSNSEKNFFVESSEQSFRKESQQFASFEHSLKNRYRCNFDTWNEYFEELIYKIREGLKGLCKAQNNDQKIYEKSNIHETQLQIYDVFNAINQVKQQLILLSNVYKRFVGLIESSQAYQNGQTNRILKFYHQIVVNNLNRIHSLFLIYSLFKVGNYQHQKFEPQQSLNRLKRAIKQLLERFDDKRQANINCFKQQEGQILQINKLNQTICKQSFRISRFLPHEFFNSAKQLILVEQKNAFGLFLEYLLSNLSQFEQTAYFYYLIRKELENVIQNEEIQNKSCKNDKASVISNISNRSKTIANSLGSVFPYMSSSLIEFFKGIRQVQGLSNKNKFGESDIMLKMMTAKRLQKLSLQIGVESFKFYMIQLCSQLNLPNQIIEIVDSIKIQPFVNSGLYPSGQLHIHPETKIKISRTFGEQETFIIKSLINSAFNSTGQNNSTNIRQLLFYQAKRILQIQDFLINHSNYHIEYLNFYRNYFNPKPNDQNQYKPDMNKSKKTSMPQIPLKKYLLTYFAEAYLFYFNKQSIRLLDEFKRQCLTSAEEKVFFQSVVDEFLENSIHS